ncbi:MAG: tetratricopeptide repeat protein, partial [Bacteroidales bacterium]|nr:tetratricopeptide repeat protein [Bacteroidales bacterium]
ASYGRCFVRCSEMYLTLRDFTQADEKLSIAEALIENENLDMNILHAEVHHTRGIYLIKTGESKASLSHLIESIDIRRILNGDYDTQLASTYNKLGVNYYILGNFEKALSCYNQALYIIDYNENEPGLIDAEVYNNIGIVLKLKGDFITALDYYHSSLEIKEQILQPDDPNLARTYNNVGNLSRMMGKSGLAMNYYESAVDIFVKKFGLRYPTLGKIYTNLGILYKDNGDYAKALQYLNQALNILDEIIDGEEISSVYNNIGNVYYELDDFEKALSYYHESVSIREIDKTKFLARSYSNFALCYDRLDMLEESEKYHNLAIESRIRYYGDNHYLLASEYMNYGQACIDRNEKEKGINLYHEALAIYKSSYGDKHPKTSSCLVNIGDYYLDDHHIIQSLDYYQQALIAIVEDFDISKDVDGNPDIYGNVLSKLDLLHALEKKANALNKSYSVTHNMQDLESSIATYQLAIDLIDNIRIGHLSRDSKLALAKNQKELFFNAINVASDAYEVTNNPKYQELAFNTAERGKAGMLYDLIRETKAKHFAHIPDSLLENERKLKENITLYKNLIHNELLKASAHRDNDKLNLWEEKVFHFQDQQNDLVEHFNQEYPKYYQYKYTNKIYTTQEIRDYLTENDALIEYYIGDGSLFAFCLTKNDIKVVKQEIDESFFTNIDNLPNNQSINAVINDAYTTYTSYVNSSYDLYRVLLAPFETEVEGKDLIIIPDGKLGYVSFESLLTDAADSERIDYRNLPYLINDHSISYGYSSTLLVNSGDGYQSGDAKKDLLAFAPVSFNEENARYTEPVR